MRPLLAPVPAAAGIRTLIHVPALGQSLAVSFCDASRGIDLAPLDPGRAFMFSGGWRVSSPTSVTDSIPAAALAQLIDLHDAPDYVSAARMAHRLLRDLRAGESVLCSTHGIAGQAYHALKRGTQPFANAVRALRKAALLADLAALDYRVLCVIWLQGEDNYSDSQLGYLMHLLEIQTDAEAAAREADGRADRKPLVMMQPASWTRYLDPWGKSHTRSAVPLAMMQAAVEQDVRFLLVGPSYHYPYADGIHPTDEGYRRRWQDFGRVIGAYRETGCWTPLGLGATATRAGTTVTVTFPKPRLPECGWVPPLVIDRETVTDPGDCGFTYLGGDGAPVPIRSIALAPGRDDALEIELAEATAGTLCMGTIGTVGAGAGPASGPRLCIRDSLDDLYADGTPAHNWLCFGELVVA